MAPLTSSHRLATHRSKDWGSLAWAIRISLRSTATRPGRKYVHTFFSSKQNRSAWFGDKFGESLGGSQAPPSFWKVPGLPRKFPELPRKFSATSPEVLSLWNWIAIQRFPGSFPDFPGSFPDFPGSSPDFPGGQPFLWEAWHPLLTHKNFLWALM